MIETGTVLQQRYRIDRQIGLGGMGAVYVATDERFGSTVAIKETLCMDDSYSKALEREARLLNSLKHSALPRVSDHFLEESGQFLVMEYISGEDLYCVLEKENKPFPIKQVLDWADQLLDALEFLHNQENPVIHRDIKPQNLKITPRGQIILLDFGLAKGNVTGAGNQTAAKSIFGYSRNYASLEQIQGTGTDPRSDLYSLAATLYHLSTNTPPEDALTRAMAVLNHRPDPLVPANNIEASVPPGVAVILQRAMDLNASGRPSTAAEMREMLQNHEKYADFAPASQAYSTGAAELHGQPTRIMPGTTRQGSDRQTYIKTQIFPEYVSQETSVRLPNAEVDHGSRRRRFGWKSAAASLLLVGVACAGFFAVDPSFFGSGDTNVPVPYVESPDAVERAPEAAPDAASVVAGSDAAETAPDAQAPKQRTAAKSTRSSPTGKKGTAAPDETALEPGTIYIGNVKVRGETVETPDYYIDENGVKKKVPKMVIPQPPIVPPNTRYLTPEQIRKLEMLRRRRTTVATPKPTP